MHRSDSDTGSSLPSASRNSDVMDLTILGSPAPRAPRRVRQRLSQPPNSPSRPLHLPIDQIMRLRGELNRRLEEGCGFLTDRASSRASSHPELAIDLSSIADSSTSAISSATSSGDESEWSPVRPQQTKTSTAKYSKYSSPYAQSRDFDSKFKGDVNQSHYMGQVFKRTERSDLSSGSCNSRCSCGTNKYERHAGQSADLIQIYVETVNNAQLSKFFRPCIACDKINCECFGLDAPQQCQLPETHSYSSLCEKCNLHFCACFPILSRGTTPSSNSSQASHCATRSYENKIAEQAADSGNSTLQLNDSSRETTPSKIVKQVSGRSEGVSLAGREGSASGIISRDHVSLSVMQLATAAQCARILADSLESVLQLAREEITEGSEVTSHKSSVQRSDSLESALCALTEKCEDLPK